MNSADSQGAIILMFNAATPSTESLKPFGRHALLSEWNDASPTKITGVRNIAIKEYVYTAKPGKLDPRIIAVLETDQDKQSVTIAYLYQVTGLKLV